MNTPDLVQFKIEPMNHTKVLTFYMSSFNNDKSSEEFYDGKHVNKSSTLSLNINNTIGISLVDSFPREIL